MCKVYLFSFWNKNIMFNIGIYIRFLFNFTSSRVFKYLSSSCSNFESFSICSFFNVSKFLNCHLK